nr:hypothetical protein [Micromonospora sp. DSM 115978]
MPRPVAEHEAVVVDFTARLLAGLIRSGSLEAVRRVLVEALPWVTFLPEPDVDQLLSELVTVTQGAASLDNLTPVAVLLTQWRHTAEVHSDPHLLEILTREPDGDFGPAQVHTGQP